MIVLLLSNRPRGAAQDSLASREAPPAIRQSYGWLDTRTEMRYGAKVADGDGYLAALISYRMIADAIWYTDEAVARMQAVGA